MRFISIDPGTINTGVALWEGQQLLGWWPITCKPKTRPVLRIDHISSAIQGLAFEQDVTTVVCEQVIHIENRRNSPLDVLVSDLKGWVTAGRKEWITYHPSTVKAAVRPNGFSGPIKKREVRLGVQMLYGMHLGGLDQNVIDAVAVGHCHIGKMKEQQLIGS